MNDVVILGAGLAGLGCAQALPQARVFEAAPAAGGHCRSHAFKGLHFDEGAHICHARDPDWLARLYRGAGAVEQISPSRVANRWQGRWITYPVQNYLHELPLEARVPALVDFVNAQLERRDGAPAHYLDWCRWQYGDFLTEQFYRLYTDKYWRVPMEELATDWLSGRLIPSQVNRIVAGALGPQSDSQAVFSTFHYPSRGGFQSFFRQLPDGLDLHLNARAVRVDPAVRTVQFADGRSTSYGRLVSTLPLPDLVGMLPAVPDEVGRAARRLRHTQLLCVNVIVRRPDLVPYHWFYIYDPAVQIARVSVLNHLAPGSVPPGCTALQAEIFRRGDESMPVEALRDGAVVDLGRMLGFDPQTDLEGVQAVHVPHAYIISDAHRQASAALVRDWLRAQGIWTTGLFGQWKFIWSDAAFRSGVETAAELRAG